MRLVHEDEGVGAGLPGCGFEVGPFGVGEGDVDGLHVLFEVFDGGGAGDGEDDRAAVQEPGEGELRGGGVVGLRELVEFAAGLRELAGRDREPGDEGDVVLGAVVEDGFALAIGDVVLVLNADDIDDLAGLFDFGDGNFRETDEADLAGGLELLDGAEGVLDGDFGVDAVKLPEVKLRALEPAEAHFDLLGEVLGAAYGQPTIRTLAGEAGLSGDDGAFGVGREGFADEGFGDGGAVAVGGVDEVDA